MARKKKIDKNPLKMYDNTWCKLPNGDELNAWTGEGLPDIYELNGKPITKEEYDKHMPKGPLTMIFPC